MTAPFAKVLNMLVRWVKRLVVPLRVVLCKENKPVDFSWLCRSLIDWFYEMFTKIMLFCMSIRRQLRRSLKLASFILLGVLLSISLNALTLSPSIAQVTAGQIPNNASIQFDSPTGETEDNPDGRTDLLSNTVLYRLSAVAGENNLGLGIVKSANKSAAEPGDVVIYTLLVNNNAGIAADALEVVDDFPLGVEFVPGSVTASIPAGGGEQDFDVVATNRQLTLSNFRDAGTAGPTGLPANQQLVIRYAATLSPDSLRGDGVNIATARDPGGLGEARDRFRLTIRPGILSDCGTILGRVFADANFDGHQQPGEPGIPNAVIYMDGGNRIITDPDGLFSMSNVVSGNRVGALDLSSLNGYTLAPNLYRIEENSQSRLVRLEPGGLARMNFAVTPIFGEGE